MIRNEFEVLSVGKVARYCCVGRATVQRWLADGKIESFKLPSGHKRVKVKDLIDFLNEYDMPVPEEFYSDFKKILVVDDDKVILKALQKMIERIPDLNVKIELATGGIQGCLKWGSFHPDLVILDLNMPDLGGLDLAKCLYGSDGEEETEVMVISGCVEEKSIEILESIGVDRILKKPFSFAEIQTHVKECLMV